MKNLFSSLFLLVLLCSAALGQTLVVEGDLTVSAGKFDVLDLRNNAQLTIDGEVTFNNINPNNYSAAKITVTKKGVLTVKSSLNMNGNYTFLNNGVLYTGNTEMQQGLNYFRNLGTHIITGNFQINGEKSGYENYGQIYVSGTTSLHIGYFKFLNCAFLETSGMDVNRDNMISGSGYIKVKDNLNLNKILTLSDKIVFWYGNNDSQMKTVNQPKNLGSAFCWPKPKCIPDPLPVKYTNLAVAVIEETALKYVVQVSFKVTENSNLDHMRLKYSIDSTTWRNMVITLPSELKVGVVYAGKFELSKLSNQQ